MPDDFLLRLVLVGQAKAILEHFAVVRVAHVDGNLHHCIDSRGVIINI
jgi:hypothetical protein